MLRKTTQYFLPNNLKSFLAAFHCRLYTFGNQLQHIPPFGGMASGCRYPPASDQRPPTVIQYIRSLFWAVLSALRDKYYRFRFMLFGKALNRLLLNKSNSPHEGIIFMIGTLGPGGAERQATLTLVGLAKRGYGPLKLICHFLHHENQRFFLPLLESTGIPTEELKRTPSNTTGNQHKLFNKLMRTLLPSLQDTSDYIHELSALRPKLVHLWLDEINIKGGLAAVAAGVPRIVLGLRSLPPQHFAHYKSYMREGYRWLARQPGVVMLNNSMAGARAYEKWLGLPKGVIRVVYNGFDFDKNVQAQCHENRDEYRARLHIPATALLLGTVIRFSEEKRPLLWLEIAAVVRRHLADIHFLIVGDGPLRATMEERAQQNDLKGSIHFTGYENDAHTAIAAMDMFLLTSRAEGLPNVLIEAQALGIPVVTTRVGGAPETVQHGKTGWVLEKDDCQHAANVIVKLLQDQEWLTNARHHAPVFVRKTFDLERMLDDTLAIYDINKKTCFDRHSAGVANETRKRAAF